jgi:hypothetical protein
VAEYRDRTMGWTAGVQFLTGAVNGIFSLRHRVQTGSGARPASCLMGTGGPYPGIKVSRA